MRPSKSLYNAYEKASQVLQELSLEARVTYNYFLCCYEDETNALYLAPNQNGLKASQKYWTLYGIDKLTNKTHCVKTFHDTRSAAHEARREADRLIKLKM